MAGNRPGHFFIQVESGTHRGLVKYITDEPVLIGSGKNANLKLQDQGVTNEHAVISLEQNHIWIENLSSEGTKVSGRIINQRAFLSVGEVFSLGSVNIKLCSDQPKKKDNNTTVIFSIVILLIVIIGVVVNIKLLRKKEVASPPLTMIDWHNGYIHIEKRLEEWSKKGKIPNSFCDNFRQAWFRERTGDKKGALKSWRILYNAMAALPVIDVTPAGKSIADSVDGTSVMLNRVMGRDNKHDPVIEANWQNVDMDYVNALWLFVNFRIIVLNKDDDNS